MPRVPQSRNGRNASHAPRDETRWGNAGSRDGLRAGRYTGNREGVPGNHPATPENCAYQPIRSFQNRHRTIEFTYRRAHARRIPFRGAFGANRRAGKYHAGAGGTLRIARPYWQRPRYRSWHSARTDGRTPRFGGSGVGGVAHRGRRAKRRVGAFWKAHCAVPRIRGLAFSRYRDARGAP